MTIDWEAKKAELLKQREQMLANLNFIGGQLALCDEVLAPDPIPTPPAPEGLNG